MNNAANNESQTVAAQAHKDAQGLIDGGVDANDMATVSFMSAELTKEYGYSAKMASLYNERFVGHFINVACSGKGV